MTEVIGVKYEELGQLTYVLADKKYKKDDLLVIKNKKGSHMAQVVIENDEVEDKKLPAELDNVFRKATAMDIKAYHQNIHLAEDSISEVEKLIVQNQLKMKLVDIVFPLERSYVLITFVSEERVDFRQLLKDLAAYFKTRIELRQINSREESKIYGGLGPCGRALCCSSFLGEFPPVSIKMLKNQSLSLNSGKSTGVCGRLMCCLSFEDDFYRKTKAKFPDLGTPVLTQNGPGIVAGIDVFTETVKVRAEDNHTLLTYAIEEVSVNG